MSPGLIRLSVPLSVDYHRPSHDDPHAVFSEVPPPMDYRVISADDHIDLRWMPQDLWSERLPAHLRARGPQVQDTEKGPHWFCDGQMWGAWGTYTSTQGSGVKWAIEVGGALREGELRPTIAEMRLADMDRDGVDAS